MGSIQHSSRLRGEVALVVLEVNAAVTINGAIVGRDRSAQASGKTPQKGPGSIWIGSQERKRQFKPGELSE